MKDSVTTPDRRSAVVGPGNGTSEFLIEDFTAAMLYSQRGDRRTVKLLVTPYLFDDDWWAARERAGAEATDDDTEIITSWAEAPELPDDITIYLHVTHVRQIWPVIEPGDEQWPWCQFPQFEVEGYLLDPPGNTGKFWVRLSLRTSDDRRLTEGLIFLLEPGEELGTDRTPGMG